MISHLNGGVDYRGAPELLVHQQQLQGTGDWHQTLNRQAPIYGQPPIYGQTPMMGQGGYEYVSSHPSLVTPPGVVGYAPEAILREQLPQGDGLPDDDDDTVQDEPDTRPFNGLTFVWIGVLGLIGASLYSMISGRISVLSHPLNYRGLACGWDDPVRHLPFVYYPIDPKDGKQATLMPRRPMCVQRCPDLSDVAKKAYLSISDASAVSVGQSLALLSVLHSVRSPVYASSTDYSSYCVPDATPLKNQFEKIIASSQTAHSSFARSIAATIVSGIPSSLLGAILAAVSSHFVANRLGVFGITEKFGIPFGALIITLVGINAAFKHSQWIGGLCCCSFAIGLIVYSSFLRTDGIRRGGQIIQDLEPKIRAIPNTTAYLIAVHILGLSTIYFTLMTFSFLQTNKQADEGNPLEFALDPNGGLKIYPLEMISTESRRTTYFWTIVQSIGVLMCGSIILECLTRFYNAIVILMTLKVHEFIDRNVAEDEPDKPDEFAMNRLFAGVMGIMQDAVNIVFTRILYILARLIKAQNHPFFSERLVRLENDSALIQYCLDILPCSVDAVYFVDYKKSEELAQKSLLYRREFQKPLNQTAAASSDLLVGVMAFIFALTYSIFIFIDDLGGTGVTPKSPLLASILVTTLFSYIAKMGISSPALAAESLLYAYAMHTDQYRPIDGDTWKAVHNAMSGGNMATNF